MIINNICQYDSFINFIQARLFLHAESLRVVASQTTSNKMYSLLTYFCSDNRSADTLDRAIGYNNSFPTKELAIRIRSWHGTCY